MDEEDDPTPAEVEVWSVPVTETYRYVRPDGTEWLFHFDRAL